MGPRSAPPLLGPAVRSLMGLLGAGSFGTGVYAVFVSQNGLGTAVLLIFGGVLFVVAVLDNRIESLEYGGAKIRLQAAAAEKFALAEESERHGESAAADRLRAEARALLDAAGPIAADYRWLRSSMRAGGRRTVAMENVLSRARQLARGREFEPDEVVRWLNEGSDEERITALAMMQAREDLRNFDAALEAIKSPRSDFEQYHAMELAVDMIDGLDVAQRRRLVDVVKAVRGWRFGFDGDRWALSEKILNRIGEN